MEHVKKSCKVTVFGDSYSLVTTESEDHIIRASQHVDTIMREIAHKAVHMDEKKVAVLAALRLASRLLQLEGEVAAVQNKHALLVQAIDAELKTGI
jgi:cell division protein ZapA (FtsZ GTPase activity inhibitor)